MKNYAHALVIAGSCLPLSACMYKTPVVYVTSCVGTPAIPLRENVITQMNRQELLAYNKYKQYWKENCKYNSPSDVARLR